MCEQINIKNDRSFFRF